MFFNKMIIILAAAAFMMFFNSSQQGSMRFTNILHLTYFRSYMHIQEHMQECSDIQARFMASGFDFLSWLRNGSAGMNIGFM